MLQVNTMFRSMAEAPSGRVSKEFIGHEGKELSKDQMARFREDYGLDNGCCLCECCQICLRNDSWKTGLCSCCFGGYDLVGVGLACQSVVPCYAQVIALEKLKLADNLLLMGVLYALSSLCVCMPCAACICFRHSYAKAMDFPESRWYCGFIDTCCIVTFCFPCSISQIQLDHAHRVAANDRPLNFKMATTCTDHLHLFCGILHFENNKEGNSNEPASVRITPRDVDSSVDAREKKDVRKPTVKKDPPR